MGIIPCHNGIIPFLFWLFYILLIIKINYFYYLIYLTFLQVIYDIDINYFRNIFYILENFNSLILYLYINCISFFKKIPSEVRENSYRGCWRRCCRRAQWRTWGKWYIASPEGFDLPEGLEYLKNSWEGSIEEQISFKRKEIFKYSAKIKICSIDLCSSLKRVSFLLNNAWSYNAGVEFKDCPRKCTSLKIPYLRIFSFVTKLKIQALFLFCLKYIFIS